MFVSFLLTCYFSSLIMLCWLSHPIYHCVLLIINSLCSCGICYIVYGFSWYPLLFCLVYVGGVYILFVFISVHTPNRSQFIFVSGIKLIIFFVLIVVTSYCVADFRSALTYNEGSTVLCNITEGSYYVCLCLTLLFGFIILSVVSSINGSHYR